MLGEGQTEQTRHGVRCGPGGERSQVNEEWGSKEKMKLRDLECSVIALDLGHYWSLKPRKILKMTCLFQEETEEGLELPGLLLTPGSQSSTHSGSSRR